jgi:polynucleotide 5'-kinase involved in rRNA processing
MKDLKISKEITLPIDAVTQTIAAIGRKGAGKTYLASMIAEQMLDAKAQVVVLDPIGNWYGLRIGKDGTSSKDI